MKISGLFIAAALLVGSVGATAAEARPNNDRHHASQSRSSHHNKRPRHMQKKRVCKNVWRHGHRERVCRYR